MFMTTDKEKKVKNQRKKRMLVALFVIVMTAMTLIAFGASAQAEQMVFVGSQGYSSISDAVNAIALMPQKEGTIVIAADIETKENVTIPSGVRITVTDDGKPHTIIKNKNNVRYDALFVVESGGSLTIDGNLTFKPKKGDTTGNHSTHACGLIFTHGLFSLINGTLDFNENLVNSYDVDGVVTVSGREARFVMDGGTIRNAKLTASSGGVKVRDNGKFVMNGGTITDMDAGGQVRTGAVLVYSDNNPYLGEGTATFEMNGGVIENNKGYRGIGVYVVGVEYRNRSQMIMNGGTIQNNVCKGWITPSHEFQAAGGAIFIEGNAVVTMNDGLLQNNMVYMGMGGAVAASDNYWGTFPGGPDSPGAWTIEKFSRYYPAGFIMNGGIIRNNKATKETNGADSGCGGGIYSASNQVILKGGVIEGNYAERQGGGIYVGSIPYELKIYDAIVTNNHASVLGGGVWACPTGDVEVFVTNGAAIYDNTSAGAGDDVVAVRTVGKSYCLTLADRALGGGRVYWYKDGGILDDNSILGTPNRNEKRYDANSGEKPLEQIRDNLSKYALKSVASEEAKVLAANQASLIIRNNTSARGGGIGTNGGITIGEKENEYALKVTKVWKNTEEALKQPVKVYLKIGDVVLDPVELNAENNWTAWFTQLPDMDTLKGKVSYAVVEDPVPENFEPAYSQAVIDEDKRTIQIDVSNRYISKPVSVEIKAKKVMDGQAPTSDTFTFQLKDEQGRIVQTKKNKGSDVVFDPFEFDRAGTYVYELSEQAEDNSNIIYDTSTYKVIVSITNANGLSASVSYEKDGKPYTGIPVFKNETKHAKPISVEIKAKKMMDGAVPTSGAFTFQLKDEKGRIVQTKKNSGSDVVFDSFEFDSAGTYVYELSEQANDNPDIVFDTSTYKIIVSITDSNGLTASVSYEKDGKPYTGTPVFNNETRKGPEHLPQTGDGSHIWEWGLFGALSLCTAVGILAKKPKNKKS